MLSKGIIYIIIASFAFSLMNIAAKDLAEMHPMQVVFFRAFGTFILLFPVMVVKKIPILGTHVKLLVLRAIVGLTSLATFFIAIQRIPLGAAISIRYVGPIFGAVLALYILKEKIKPFQWVGFAIAFSGVLVVKGFDLRVDLISLILLLVSAFFVGLLFVLLRYLGPREHYMTIINYFMVFSMTFSLFFIGHWRMPVGHEWISIIGIGIFGLVGQVFMTIAYKTEETSILAPFVYLELVFALVIAFFIFGEGYTPAVLAGILLIVCGMIVNVRARRLSKVK